jgi:putative membrane protein
MPISLPIIGEMKYNKSILAIGLIWLFQLSATIGILLGKAEWFLSKTPYTLFLYSLLCLWIFPFKDIALRHKALLLILIGFVSEWIGINHLSIFGEYYYGKNFGLQIDGTPLIIGFNWMVLALVSKSIVSRFLSNRIMVVIAAAGLMVLLDVAMEFVAYEFAFWHFKGGMPPFRNYLSWFIIGLLMQLIISKENLKAQYRFSLHYYLINLLFFSFFAFYYSTN